MFSKKDNEEWKKLKAPYQKQIDWTNRCINLHKKSITGDNIYSDFRRAEVEASRPYMIENVDILYGKKNNYDGLHNKRKVFHQDYQSPWNPKYSFQPNENGDVYQCSPSKALSRFEEDKKSDYALYKSGNRVTPEPKYMPKSYNSMDYDNPLEFKFNRPWNKPEPNKDLREFYNPTQVTIPTGGGFPTSSGEEKKSYSPFSNVAVAKSPFSSPYKSYYPFG